MIKKLHISNLLLVLLTLLLPTVGMAKNQSNNKDSLSILILSSVPLLDKGYEAKLKAEGMQVACTSYYQTFSYDFLKKFNLIVLDKTPLAGEEHGIFRNKELHFVRNWKTIKKYVNAGGGLLVYPNLADCGGPRAGGFKYVMSPWGIEVEQSSVSDAKRASNKWVFDNSMNWTEKLNKTHPVTKDLKRIYYPSAILRWDDCYATPPLICDKNWTPIVETMPGTDTRNFLRYKWIFNNDTKKTHTLGAIRDVGKGRVGVLSINPIYTHRNGCTLNPHVSEMSTGPVDGIVLEKGDGKVASDTGKMLMNLYKWLGSNSNKGFGGYKTGDPIVAQKYVKEEKLPTKYFKFLVGVHSSYSDGNGTVKEYAEAAKKAGYSVIIFAENFAKMKPGAYQELIRDCEKYSDNGLICVPGYEIDDQDRNTIILAGAPRVPPKAWLTDDGKKLLHTQMVYLCLYNTLTIIHHADSNPMPKERLKHFQAMSVYTYRDGKLLDNSLSAYMWQVKNASNPHPIAVHDVFSPAKVALAAKTGFQQVIPADTVKNAEGYFRVAIRHYYESPARYMITEGPIIDNWRMAKPKPMDKYQMQVSVGVKSDDDLKYVKIYDGFHMVRKWLPRNSKNFQQTAFFRDGAQFHLFVMAEDKAGRKVISSSIRTTPERLFVRCSDRQNWLGHIAIYYTGQDAMGGLSHLKLPVEGVTEGEDIFTPVRGACMAAKASYPFCSGNVVLTQSQINEKYVRALYKEVAFDAKPSMVSKTSNIYDALIRHWSFKTGKSCKFNLGLVEYDIKLKRDVEPVVEHGMFPLFVQLLDKKYTWYKDGKLVSGTIPDGKTIDVPVGGMVGGFIVLSPGMAAGGGWLGMKANLPGNGELKKGTCFSAKMLYTATGKPNSREVKNHFGDPAKWLNILGLGPDKPYKLKISRGQLEKNIFPLTCKAVNGGVAGTVEKTADLPIDTTVCVTDLSGKMPVGMWRQGDSSIDYTGVFENAAYFMLDTSVKGKFFAGNLIFSDNPDLQVEIVYWTSQGIFLEVHNPTKSDITAQLKTPREITGLYRLDTKLTVISGSSKILKMGTTP